MRSRLRPGATDRVRTRIILGTWLLLVLAPVLSPTARASEPAVRIALTAGTVRDQLPFYDRWAAYLEQRLGRPVQFVQRRSYRDTIELLRTGELDFAWVCSYSFLQALDLGLADLVGTPLFHGGSLYQSYIIVHKDSSAKSLFDLEGKSFAYADPDSTTGYVVPRAMLRDAGRNPDHFFRLTFFTWDHGQAIEAVAEKVADGAAVDSYVWEYMATKRPDIAQRTKIIQRSDQFGFPPIVARRGIDPALKQKFAATLFAMANDSEGRALLQALMLDGFTSVSPSHYDSVRQLSQRFETTRQPPNSSR